MKNFVLIMCLVLFISCKTDKKEKESGLIKTSESLQVLPMGRLRPRISLNILPRLRLNIWVLHRMTSKPTIYPAINYRARMSKH